MTFIEVRGLRKSYKMGREVVHALAGVDLDIHERTFSAVIGPSGSGKSTLLYLVGGLDRPSAGHIRVEGQALDQMNENQLAAYRQQTVGFVFQSFNLIPSMTALDNVIFPLRFSPFAPEARREKAISLLKQVGLADRAYHRPTELSGGQQQRVAIARALVNNPRLILADEPTGNLDTHSGALVLQMLLDLHSQGRTVLMVTHDPRLAQFATQTIRFSDGEVVDAEEFDRRSAQLVLDRTGESS